MSPNDKRFSKFWAVILALGLAACDGGAAASRPYRLLLLPSPRSRLGQFRCAFNMRGGSRRSGKSKSAPESPASSRKSPSWRERRSRQDDVLFRIDPAPYEAVLARAKAQLKEAQAQVHRTQRDAERATNSAPARVRN